MSRLASFRGPSTPTSSPVQHKSPKQSTPSSSARAAELTYHRKLRSYAQDLRSIADTWDDLVLIDGLRAAKGIVDTRTDLDNALALIPNRQPRTHLVRPKLSTIDKHLSDLDAILAKLQKLLRRMTTIIDSLEALFAEATTTKGYKWTQEPLWTTWSLEQFGDLLLVTSFSRVASPYYRSLTLLTELVDKLRSHSISFEESRKVIAMWVAQPWLEDEGWEAKWEDICAVEIECWESSR
ncbi:hypothetical protein AMATHDRAFT_48188 [Amanita thiersii Skay4041]|uniref:Uncharacterized protein n=1 Tax=Amanita thiersii Skay4041 TaxID=703135 RepID=A0A2A9NIZ2_9AGAR|nr:hypothetical protein AMATHDRAFT_48188 [Amanita thiersii Skay4041]